ncbi:MAG: hypothetical protein PW786_10265 [Arachidicoccus sp.]|nr:hypothetical protein [Arachidicoccus sp.]
MAIIEIDKFKAYLGLDGTKSIIVNSDQIEECMRIYIENNLDGVAITTSHDYKLQNVDFLANYPNIKQLSISDGIEDISAINTLHDLESLMISGKNRKVDYAWFPKLKQLIADWSPHFLNMDKCKSLKNLSLYGYNPKTKDCSSISNIPWIEKLKIVHSPINTLNGLEHFNQLKELELAYCSKLETLCCIENSKESLVTLFLDHCKGIKNIEYVTQFYNLRNLDYKHGALSSIKFIKNMKALKSFIFVGTDVADGDITACIGLKFVNFSNKKHFSHTMEEIKKLTASMRNV